MHSVLSTITLWLAHQCQSTHQCTQGALIAVTGDDKAGKTTRLATWLPQRDNLNTDTNAKNLKKNANNKLILDAVAQVMSKQRLHLMPLQNAAVLVAYPITFNHKPWGAVVLELATADKNNVLALVKQLQTNLHWLQLILSLHRDQQDAGLSASPHTSELNKLIRALLKEKTLGECSITLVNFLATHLGCARVSFGIQMPKGVALEAVSFCANFDSRTPAMHLIVDAMNEAVDQRTDILFPLSSVTHTGDQPVAHSISRCHEHLCSQQAVASLRTYLLRKDDAIIGALIFESAKEPLSDQKLDFIQHALPSITEIIALKITASASISRNIKTLTVNHLEKWFGLKHWHSKLVVALVTLFITSLFFPADYWITTDANLQSTHRHLLVAPQDGYLSVIKARPGDLVKANDLLAHLNDDDLRLEKRKIQSQLEQAQQEYDNALATANRVQATIANEKVDQGTIQLQLIEQQLQRTQLLAPIDGIVVSDDISQTLGAPIKQGQVLFEIAAVNSFIVQLFVDERDIAAIQLNQKGQLKLASLPGELFEFTVSKITPLSEIRNGRNCFRIEATLTKNNPMLRPGMTGPAKVLAGNHLQGWIWFHDLWHWLRLMLWW